VRLQLQGDRYDELLIGTSAAAEVARRLHGAESRPGA
jgi:hypothetical protein